MKVFRARHLATMLCPVIDDGCVIVEGDRIVEAGPTHLIRPPRVDVEIDGVLMPGLINAHTHLELTNVPRPPSTPSSPIAFVDWVIETITSQRRATREEYSRDRAEGIRQGVAQCVKFGVTCVGDISQNVEVVRPILVNGPIRSVSFGECLGIGERRARFDELLQMALKVTGLPKDHYNEKYMSAGISPHAPYTVDLQGYVSAVVEQPLGFHVTTHLAETPDETRFIQSHTGPLAALYARIGINPGRPTWPDTGFDGSAVSAVGGATIHHPLLAHVNYCNDTELDQLAVFWDPSVVWCPRTHRYFGHPPHRWKDMLARDINVCVGTDSCASSPDLNVVDDLRLLHASEPDVAVERLWAMVTRDAERGLRWGTDEAINTWEDSNDSMLTPKPLGVVAPLAMADFIAFATKGGEPLREILETPRMLPSGVWVGGERVGVQ